MSASVGGTNNQGDGSLPVPGWTGEYDWEGWVAFEDMPHAYNPKKGFIMSANHKVAYRPPMVVATYDEHATHQSLCCVDWPRSLVMITPTSWAIAGPTVYVQRV